eukprot:71333_1
MDSPTPAIASAATTSAAATLLTFSFTAFSYAVAGPAAYVKLRAPSKHDIGTNQSPKPTYLHSVDLVVDPPKPYSTLVSILFPETLIITMARKKKDG